MKDSQATNRTRYRIRSFWTCTRFLLLVCVFSSWTSTAVAESVAENENPKEDGFWYAVIHGKPTLNVRLRVELADADPKAPPEPNGLDRSEAYTLRTRLGYGTKPWHGGMIYAEAENTTAVATNQYNNGTEGGGTGSREITDDLELIYEASYAYQTDYENNPVDYNTNYSGPTIGVTPSVTKLMPY